MIYPLTYVTATTHAPKEKNMLDKERVNGVTSSNHFTINYKKKKNNLTRTKVRFLGSPYHYLPTLLKNMKAFAC